MNKIIQGDCLQVMKDIPDKSIDMILCDLPYGTTACKWDVVIPFEPLWEQYKRIAKDNAAIVLFGSEPFSSLLRVSNLSMYRYDWIWDKKIPSGMTYARFQPMRQHESISVFSIAKAQYIPQMIKRDKPIKSGGQKNLNSESTNIDQYKVEGFSCTYNEKNPTTILQFDKVRRGSKHPTQKPVALFEYLIKTYTNEGELVLDNCAGSGTTGVACIRTGRNYILIEKEEKYYNVIQDRIQGELFKIKEVL